MADDNTAKEKQRCGGMSWQPIETMPKDGRHVLLSYTMKADELDEDDRVIVRGSGNG